MRGARRRLSGKNHNGDAPATRNFFRCVSLALLTVLLVMSAAGCGSQEMADELARVNDTVIGQADFDEFCSLCLHSQGMAAGEKLTEDERTQFLKDMVDAETLRQYYEAESPEVFSEAYQSGLDTFVSQMNGNDAEFLSANGISGDSVSFFYMSQYLIQHLYDEISAAQSQEELANDAAAYYEEHREAFEGRPLEDCMEEIYYLLYNSMYDEKMAKIREGMEISY